MKKIVFLLFSILLFASAHGQDVKNKFVYYNVQKFKGGIALIDTIGADTAYFKVISGYLSIVCPTCDSIHFFPPVAGSGGGGTDTGGWSVNGNFGTSSDTNFIGTLDSAGFTVRVHNTPVIKISDVNSDDGGGNILLTPIFNDGSITCQAEFLVLAAKSAGFYPVISMENAAQDGLLWLDFANGDPGLTQIHLPAHDGSAGDVLKTDGLGQWYFDSATHTDSTLTGGVGFSAFTFNGSANKTANIDTSGTIASKFFVNNKFATIANLALKVNISDTAAMLSTYLHKADTTAMLSTYLHKADTAAMLSTYLHKADTAAMLSTYLHKADTTSMLSTYLHKADTTAMLSAYLHKADTTAMLSTYLHKADTTAMLSTYLHKADTTAMLSTYAHKYDTLPNKMASWNRVDSLIHTVGSGLSLNDTVANKIAPWNRVDSIAGKLNSFLKSSDTTAMLSTYLHKADTTAMLSTYLHKADTTAMLSTYLHKADTTAMLSTYLHKADTTAMLSTYAHKYDTLPNKMASWNRVDSLIHTVSSGLSLNDTVANKIAPWNRVDSIAGKLNSFLKSTDTTAMLSTYLHKADTTAMLSTYLRKADTTAMLSTYLRKADTTAMLSTYLHKADTTAMLSTYLHKADTTAMLSTYLHKADTTAMLSTYLHKADTTAMLSTYLHKADTTAMLSTYAHRYDTLPGKIASWNRLDSLIHSPSGGGSTDTSYITGVATNHRLDSVNSWDRLTPYQKTLQILGMDSIKAEPFWAGSAYDANGGVIISSFAGLSYGEAMYLTKPATITGVKFFLEDGGNHNVGVNGTFPYEGFCLYSYSGGNITFIDSTTRDSLLFKGSSNMRMYRSKNFSTTHVLQPGVYFIVMLHNAAWGGTVAPNLAAKPTLWSASQSAVQTGNNKLVWTKTGATVITGTTATSGLTTTLSDNLFYFALY